MTQMHNAKLKKNLELLKEVSLNEPLSFDDFVNEIANGHIVVCKNKKHNFKPKAIGKGTYIKVNANIGISSLKSNKKEEIAKLDAAIKAGADSVMDLSVCEDLGELREIRQEIIRRSPVMVGTVPIYEAAAMMKARQESIVAIKEDDILKVIRNHAEDGVDFMTIHAGVTKKTIERLKEEKRLCGIVSRGGSILAEWMKYNNKENIFYTLFDEILDIAYEYDITLSLGDGLRPGAIHDGTDKAQIEELIILGELVERAREKNVQVMVEGPGHIKLSDIEMNIKLQKRLCHEAPFYVLGPLVTDIAPGYDHITSAIGAAIAGFAGADFICYVTPAEHLHLPEANDVYQGVIAARIAAHAADLALGKGNAQKWDDEMSIARKNVDWHKMAELAIDKNKVLEAIRKYKLKDSMECTMCGTYCAFKRDY